MGATIKTGQHKTKAIDRKNMKSFVRTVSVFQTSKSLNGYKMVFGLYRTIIDTFFPKQTKCSMSSFHLIHRLSQGQKRSSRGMF